MQRDKAMWVADEDQMTEPTSQGFVSHKQILMEAAMKIAWEPAPEWNLIRPAVEALGIDVPVQRAERLPGGGLRLWLQGGEVVTWSPPQMERDRGLEAQSAKKSASKRRSPSKKEAGKTAGAQQTSGTK